MRSYKAARRAAKREAVDFEVTWYDDADAEHADVFHAYGVPSMTTLSDAGYFADMDAETPEAAAIIRKIFEESIGDAVEFSRFWRVARMVDNDTLVDIMADLIEDTTGRPTERPSASAASSSSDGQSSKVVSLPGGFLIQAPPAQPSTSMAESS